MSIKKNSILNIGGTIIPLAVSLVTIPAYLELIGEARFGILAIAWLLLGYFGLFDLGLGRATAQRIAVQRTASAGSRAQTFWTALSLNFCLGIIGGLLIWPIATYFFESVFIVEESLRPEIQAAVPWLVFAVPMATLSGVFVGGLQGREQFLELNIISVIGAVLFQLLPLGAALLWGPDLSILLPVALFARLLMLMTLFARCGSHILFGQPVSSSRNEASHLIRFGGWVTITAFVGPIMVVLDRFIIGAIAGAREVAYYTVPFQLAERSTLVAGAMASALFPRFASADLKEEKRLAHEAIRMLVVVTTPLVATGIIFIQPFVKLWISPQFADQSMFIGEIILLGFWVNGFARVASAQLQARGRPDIVAKCHMIELLPYICLLYICLTTFGLPGAALAFSLRVLADLVLLAGFAGILSFIGSLLLIPCLLLAVAWFLSNNSLIPLSASPLVLMIYLVVVFFWAWVKAPKSLRDLVCKQTSFLSRFPK